MFNAKELKVELIRAEMTQKELAKSIGISEPTLIRKMRTGKFSITEACAICELLQCDPASIFFAQLVT